MTSDSLWALQAAVHTALAGDATLQGLIGNPARVYDHVPQDSVFPYVVTGEARAKPFDTATTDGMAVDLAIHTWSRYRGSKETKDLVNAVLDDAGLTVTGHTLVSLRFDSAETKTDKDGLTRHGTLRFRAVTQAP